MTGRFGRQTAVRMAVTASFGGFNVAAETAADLSGRLHTLMWYDRGGHPRNLGAKPRKSLTCGL